MKGAGEEALGMGTDPTPRGEPMMRSSPNLQARSSRHRPRGKTRKKAENISFECLLQHSGKTSSASKRRHFLSSPPSTLSGSPALRRGEIRPSACSLSRPDHRGSVSTSNTISRAFSFSQPYFLFLSCQSSVLAGQREEIPFVTLPTKSVTL